MNADRGFRKKEKVEVEDIEEREYKVWRMETSQLLIAKFVAGV